MKFHEKLKLVRESREMSQTDLAERSGISIGSIRHIEQGNRLPSFTVLQMISKALGVDLGGWEGLEVEPTNNMLANKPKKKGKKS